MLKPKTSIPICSYLGKVVGRKVEPQNHVVVHQRPTHSDSEQLEFLMASKPQTTNKKKKKKSKKGTIVKKQTQIPWGVNQERLKNYILAEQEKYLNALQRRNTRTTVTKKDTFLQLIQKNAKSFMKKKKPEEQKPSLKICSQKYKQFTKPPIHYTSPAAKVQKRNRSLSQDANYHRNKIRTSSLHENRVVKPSKQKKILVQYIEKPQNRNCKLPSEPEIDALDDSFYSQKVVLETQQDEKQPDHTKQIITIQKYWRGALIRKNLKNILMQQVRFTNEDEVGGFDLNTLSKSQIDELIKLKYVEKDSTDHLRIVDESSIVSQSRPISQNDYLYKEPLKKTDNQYRNFVENFQEEEPVLLLSSNKNREQQLKILQPNEEQSNSRQKKINFLSIDVEEQEEENKVDIGEIRCAFGSESLLKSLSQEGDSSSGQQEKSIFDQTAFQDFVMNKFKELMQRDKMDQLLQLREEILQQRQQQTQKSIDKALQSNQISPRTFEIQQKRLEKWVNKQKNDLEQKKRDILKGQQSAYEAVMKTQKDMALVKQMQQHQNSQTFIKIIDSLSQESANYSESSLKNSVIDIQNQIEKKEASDDFSLKLKKTSNNILEEKEMICPEPFNLQRLAQSQVVRSIEPNQGIKSVSEKFADSYTILISNMLISEELSQFYREMQHVGVDLDELISRQQTTDIPKIQQKKQKGLKTNVLQVKQYLRYLEDYLIDHSLISIQRAINYPLGPSSKMMLKFLQPIRDSLESDFDSHGQQHTIILSAELFGKFEKYLMEQQIINHSSKQIVEFEHIHNKAIYDSLNESLDQFRPYGLIGQPFSWKPDPMRLKFRDKQLTEIPEIIRKASEKVMEWSHYMTGLIVDKEDSPFPKALIMDQEALAQIREDRLYRMLTLDTIDSEERWTNYDEEVTEISIDIADLLFDQLMEELAFEIKK